MRFQYKDANDRVYPMEVRVHHTRPPQVIKQKWPEGATISVNIGNTLAVTSLDKLFEDAGILYGHTGRKSNGVTTVTLGIGEQGTGPKDPAWFKPLMAASASCSKRDQFSKKIGRQLAMARLVKEVLAKDERLGEALGLFLAERGWK